MTGRKWTDPSQEAWLKKQFSTFLLADSTATRRKFFGDVCTEWHKKWPDAEPSSDEVKTAGGDSEAAVSIQRKVMDKRIRTWFDNHKRPKVSGKIDAGATTRSVLNLGNTRAWQPWQAYADLKYKELKPEITAQFNELVKKWEEGHEEGEKKPLLFTFRNAFLKEKLDAESDEMKAMVETHRHKMLEVAPDEVNRQYQIAIDKLPLTFATIMDNIAKQTGWNIMIMAGGPRPDDEGKITTLSYTTGKTKDGRDFKEFLGTKLEAVEEPYDDFLHECFSAEDCAARALCDGEHNEEGDDDNEREGEEKVDETDEESKKSKAKGKLNDVPQWKMSEYEIVKERNIAENQAILAKLRNPDFEAAMGELKKGPAVPRKNKASKANGEERRTSARLSTTNRTSTSDNGDSASSGKNADLLDMANENVGQVPEEVEVGAAERASEGETPNEADNDTEGTFHQGDMTADSDTTGPQYRPGSTLLGPVDHAADVTMTDGHLGNEDQPPTSCRPTDSPFASPIHGSTNVSAPSALSVNDPQVVMTPSTAIAPKSPPATSVTTAQDGAASAGSSPLTSAVEERPVTDESLPAFLTTAIVAHLRGASSTATWQSLVTAYLRFEATDQPSGKLSTMGRPPEVAVWVRRHVHKKHEPVTISDDYGARFRAWWVALQPSWRVTSSASLSRAAPPTETWASLKKGGSAGLYVVVMALSWWVASPAGSNNSQVAELVDDVSWVLSLVTPTVPVPILSSVSVKRRSVGSPADGEERASRAKRART